MAIGPGKYDKLCTALRKQTRAKAAIIIIIDGQHGSGFSCQADLITTVELPELLEQIARDIRQDMVASAAKESSN